MNRGLGLQSKICLVESPFNKMLYVESALNNTIYFNIYLALYNVVK